MLRMLAVSYLIAGALVACLARLYKEAAITSSCFSHSGSTSFQRLLAEVGNPTDRRPSSDGRLGGRWCLLGGSSSERYTVVVRRAPGDVTPASDFVISGPLHHAQEHPRTTRSRACGSQQGMSESTPLLEQGPLKRGTAESDLSIGCDGREHLQ